jgi:hypothetical protein
MKMRVALFIIAVAAMAAFGLCTQSKARDFPRRSGLSTERDACPPADRGASRPLPPGSVSKRPDGSHDWLAHVS